MDSAFPLPLDEPFTTAMAVAEGVPPHHLRKLLHHGLLWSPIQKVYASPRCEDSLAFRCAALRLVVPEDCVVVDGHAGWLLGAEMTLAPNEHLELRPVSMFRPSGHGRLRNDLAASGERNLAPYDVMEVGGLRVTTPLRTALDLGRVRNTYRSISGMDQMLRLGRFTQAELLSQVERFKGMRWVTTLRAIAPLTSGEAQSPPESVLRLMWIETGLPAPRPQVEVWLPSGRQAFLDLGDEEARYAAEYDGVEWHSSPEQIEDDRDRRAEAEQLDWLIGVFVGDDLFDPRADPHARIRAGVAEARRRFGRRPF